MKLVVGLGNPGRCYEKTRHNIGFAVAETLAEKWGITVNKKESQCLVGRGSVSGVKVLLAKPQTYMNRSGDAVLELLNYYQDAIEDLIVVHDDLDLEVGRIRFKSGGGSGGHNGLKSISARLNSDEYDRLKIGIGRPSDSTSVEHYVLSEFLPLEKKILPEIIKCCVTGLETWCLKGIQQAMNQFNATCLLLKEMPDNKII